MKQTKTLLQILSCAITLTITITAAAQNKKTELNKLSFKAGQKFQTDITMKTATSMEMMGQAIDITGDMASSSLIEIKDKKEKNYNIASTITKMTVTAGAMGQSGSYDSDKKEDTSSELSKLFKDKVNVPVEMEMSEDGEITKSKKDTAKTDKADDGMSAVMGSLGGDETAFAKNAFLVIPKKVKTGDTWSDSTITDEVKIYRDYTVKSVQGHDVTLTLSGKQITKKATENMGMEINISMENKLSGEFVVDSSSGVVKQQSFTSEGTGTMDMMGQSAPMTAKTEITSTTKSL